MFFVAATFIKAMQVVRIYLQVHLYKCQLHLISSPLRAPPLRQTAL
jgi:hypothetical protein